MFQTQVSDKKLTDFANLKMRDKMDVQGGTADRILARLDLPHLEVMAVQEGIADRIQAPTLEELLRLHVGSCFIGPDSQGSDYRAHDSHNLTAAQAALAIEAVPLADDWAVRELHICVRDLAALTTHAWRLVDHLLE